MESAMGVAWLRSLLSKRPKRMQLSVGAEDRLAHLGRHSDECGRAKASTARSPPE